MADITQHHGYAVARVDGDRVVLRAPGGPLRFAITALADDPPLTPISARDLLVPGAATDARIYGAANALVAQGDAFVVVGMKTLGSGAAAQDDFLVARMLADGGRDDSFGDGGSVTLAWPAYHFVDPLDAGFDADLQTDVAFAVAAQGSKLLVAGTVASQGGQSGAYGLARFSADGALDTCIVLRTAIVKDDVMHVQAGAGIVHDSDPASEQQECINKAKALFRAAEEAVRFASRSAKGQ